MHSDYESFAIDWVPRQGSALSAFGAGWTGWCPDRGVSTDLPEYRRLRRGRTEMPGKAALRGLHAELKAPFRLAKGQTVWSLDHELLMLAQSLPAVRLPRFEITVFDGQVVLSLTRPTRSVLRLSRYIDELVRPLQRGPRYRSYTGESSVAGISIPGMHAWTDLIATSVERFLVPLSDRMELELAFEMADSLAPALRSILDETQFLSEIALLGNPGHGRPWRVIERYPLAEEPMRSGVNTPAGMACKGPQLFEPLAAGMAIV